MRSLLFIFVTIAAVFSAAVALLMSCGIRIPLNDPIAAGAISASAAILGVMPIMFSKRKDAVGIFQLALVGTVLHLFAAVAFTAVAVAVHLVAMKLGFVYWLLAGYWLSLILLIWQLRHRLLAAIDLTKRPATI